MPRHRIGTLNLIYIMQNTQQKASLTTVATAHPLLPAFRTTTKKRSPNTFKTALMIRKYRGVALSPNALKVLEKKL